MENKQEGSIPSPFAVQANISSGSKKELAEIIRQKTGCGSFILLTKDAPTPCLEKTQGKECAGHIIQLLSFGVLPEYIQGILEEVINTIKDNNNFI